MTDASSPTPPAETAAPKAAAAAPPYRVRLVLDFEARGEDPYGLTLVLGYLKTLLSLPRGATLSFETIVQGFPGARARAAAVELTRPDGAHERQELEAP